jgi:hypothetical protein
MIQAIITDNVVSATIVGSININLDIDDAALLTPAGAANIGEAGGGTVQAVFDRIEDSALRNVAVGAGSKTGVGELNVFIGEDAGAGVVDGGGSDSGLNNALGIVAIGAGALALGAFGHDYSIFIGKDSGGNATGGYCTVAVGIRTGESLTAGAYNTLLGTDCGKALTVGGSNLFAGAKAGISATTADGNVLLGVSAGYHVTAAQFCVALGTEALSGTVTVTAIGTVAIGFRAGFKTSSGGSNVLVGYEAGYEITSGSDHVILGSGAGRAITTQYGNVFLGSGAGQLSTGNEGLAVGYRAGNKMTGANTFVGANAGKEATSAAGNVVLGRNAFNAATTAIWNTVVGEGAFSGATNWTNATVIGFDAQPNSSNSVTLGDGNVSTLRCNATTITALSDLRDKREVRDLELGLDFILSIRPVSFEWATRKGSAKDGSREAGFIAQELDSAQLASDAAWLGLVDHSDPDRLEASPGKLLSPLVKAVQELAARVHQLEAAARA